MKVSRSSVGRSSTPLLATFASPTERVSKMSLLALRSTISVLLPTLLHRQSQPHNTNEYSHFVHRAVDQFLLPWILEAASSTKPRHIFLVAHGIFNPEIIAALMRRRAFGAGTGWENTGSSSEFSIPRFLPFPPPVASPLRLPFRLRDADLLSIPVAPTDTGWTRLEIKINVSPHDLLSRRFIRGSSTHSSSFPIFLLSLQPLWKQDPSHPSSTTSTIGHPTRSDSNPTSIPAAPSPTLPTPHPGQPKLDVRILLVNQTGHLKALKAQYGETDKFARVSLIAAGGGDGGRAAKL